MVSGDKNAARSTKRFKKLPENLTIDQVVDHMIFGEKVQKGLSDSLKNKAKTCQMVKIVLTGSAIENLNAIGE
jgi:hypothetical protein